MVPEEQPPTPDAGHETDALLADPAKTSELHDAIVTQLKTVFDPEIPVNIWELGLVYDVFVTAEGVAGIRMTLTAPRAGRYGREGGRRVGARVEHGPHVGRGKAPVGPLVSKPASPGCSGPRASNGCVAARMGGFLGRRVRNLC
jgi:hypothetical protein